MFVLGAVPDGWVIGFGIFQVLFSAIVSAAIWRLTSSQRHRERQEDVRRQQFEEQQRQRERQEDARRQEFAEMLAQRSQAFERADEERKAQLAEAKAELARKGAELHSANEKLVDGRIRGWTHDVGERMQPLLSMLELVQKRIADSEEDLSKLGDRDQKIELGTAGKIDTLKDFIRDNMASKKDLEKHEASVERKFTHLDQAVGTLSREVGVLSERVNKQPARRGH